MIRRRVFSPEVECFVRYRCVVDERERIRVLGDTVGRDPCKEYRDQKRLAGLRGISWEMSLPEWWLIWDESGCYAKRGTGRHSFVMCRRRDEGPYSLDNVFIATAVENHSDVKIKRKWLPIGVTLQASGRYQARSWLGGKQLSLGTFDTPEEAHAEYLHRTGAVA